MQNSGNLSYWETEYYLDDIDVAVIGGGYVGLSSAYFIKTKYPHLNVHIFERGVIASGASSKNAGFACFGSLSEILHDFNIMGERQVLDLIKKRWDGLKLVRDLLGDEQIDFEASGGYELFRNEDQAIFSECEEQLEFVNDLLSGIIGTNVFEIKDELIEQFEFKDVDHIIFNQYEGVLNPVKMLKGLLSLCENEGIKVHFGFELDSMSQKEAYTELKFLNGFKCRTKQLAVCTNGFINNLINLPVSPARAQVLITNKIDQLKFKGAFHFYKGFYYFRNLDGRILFGGGRNTKLIEEETSEFGTTDIIIDHLTSILKKNILSGVDFEIEQTWSGIMGIGDDKTPIVSKYENIYIAVRLGGMGVAIGLNTGKDLSELIEI